MKRSTKIASIVQLAMMGAAFLSATQTVQGALLKIDFTGQIDLMTTSGPGVSGGGVVGTLFYDDESRYTTFLTPGQGNDWGLTRYASGVYSADGPIQDGTGLDMKIAGRSVAPPSNGLIGGSRLQNSWDPSVVVYSFASHARDENGIPFGVNVWFETDKPDLFRDGKIPADLKLSDLTAASIGIVNAMYGEFRDDHFSYSGSIQSLTITPVPEPAWTLVALLGATAWVARRRQSLKA